MCGCKCIANDLYKQVLVLVKKSLNHKGYYEPQRLEVTKIHEVFFYYSLCFFVFFVPLWFNRTSIFP